MKVSNAYFKHPISGEIIKPGEMYDEFDKRAVFNNGEASHQGQASDSGGSSTGSEGANNEVKTLQECNLTELRKIAKEKKIEGSSKMGKEQLIQAIQDATIESNQIELGTNGIGGTTETESNDPPVISGDGNESESQKGVNE